MRRIVHSGIAGLLIGAAPLLAAQFPAQNQQPRQPQAQQRQQPQQPATQPAVVATVNGDPITRAEVQVNLQSQTQGRQVAPEVQQQLRKQVIDSLIESRLVEQYALKQGPDVEEKEVGAVIDRFKEQLKQQGVTFDDFLRSRGYTEESLEKRISGSLAWQKYQQEQLSEEKLREFYDENKEQFGSAGFDEARQKVAQAYVTELWQEAVEKMRPKAKIEKKKTAQSQAQPRGPALPDRR